MLKKHAPHKGLKMLDNVDSNTPNCYAANEEEKEKSEAKRQRKLHVPLEKDEFSCTSSFFDGVSHNNFNPATKQITFDTTSESTSAYFSVQINLKPLLERTGFKLTCDSSAAYTAKTIQLARQLSSSTAATETTAVVDETTEGAKSVKETVEREVTRCIKYGSTQCFKAHNPSTKETSFYKIDINKQNTDRIDIKFTCIEAEKTTTLSIYEKVIVKRVLTVAGIGPTDTIKELFETASTMNDDFETDEEPWHLVFHKSGLVKIMAKLPEDEFTEDTSIYAPVLKLYLLD